MLTIELVRAVQMQEQISGLISKATELHEQLERERAAANVHLDRLAAISAGVDRAKQQPLPQLLEVCAPCLASQRSQGQAQQKSDDTLMAPPWKLQSQQCHRQYVDPVCPCMSWLPMFVASTARQIEWHMQEHMASCVT